MRTFSGSFRFYFALILTVQFCGLAAAHATTFYVSPSGSDSNNGSSQTPWKTISHAASLAQPGWTIMVRPGTYTENTSWTGGITLSHSGTSTSHIRYVSSSKWGALIRGSKACFGLNVTGQYVDVVGFDISNGSYSCSQTVGIMLGTYDRALENRIHDLPIPCTSTAGAAIAFHANSANATDYHDHDSEASGNVIHNINVTSTCTDRVHAQGIYFSSPHGKAFNNIVSNITANCISSWHASSYLQISGNTVMNCGNLGITIGADNVYPAKYTNYGSVVTDNIIYGAKSYGLYENGSVSGTKFINNIVYSSGGTAKMISGSNSGMLVANPLFVNYTGNAMTGNYHLQSTSPARDSGTSTIAPAIDHDGGHRPVNATYDRGAYEYGATGATYPWQ